MAINRGKQFEKEVQKQLKGVQRVSVDRAYDNVDANKGVGYGWDFFVYKYPVMLYLECKSVAGGTLSLTRVRETQWMQLSRKSTISGVQAGFLVWFIGAGKTFYVPIETMNTLRVTGAKSLRLKHLLQDMVPGAYEVQSIKRRGGVFCNYNFEKFLEELTRRVVDSFESHRKD